MSDDANSEASGQMGSANVETSIGMLKEMMEQQQSTAAAQETAATAAQKMASAAARQSATEPVHKARNWHL